MLYDKKNNTHTRVPANLTCAKYTKTVKFLHNSPFEKYHIKT